MCWASIEAFLITPWASAKGSGFVHQYFVDLGDVVKAGQVVKVKVIEVDLPRKRIALTMRMGDQPQAGSRTAGDRRDPPRGNARPAARPDREPAMAGSLASAFAKALKK